MSPLVPALLVVAALLVRTQPGSAAARVRSAASPGARPTTPGPPPLLVAALALAVVTLGLAAAALLAGALLAGRRLAGRAVVARAARANAAALPDLCRSLAAELRAGAPPPAALGRVADAALPDLAAHLRRLAAAGHLGTAPHPDAWTGPSGAERLRAVGAVWAVASGAGAGLADGLDRLADALAAEGRQRAEVAAQLAGPRASAAVLAALPGFGLALAAAVGADPLAFLTTPAGLGCLTAAAALDATGLWWVRRLTRAATA